MGGGLICPSTIQIYFMLKYYTQLKVDQLSYHPDFAYPPLIYF